ncbi:MAG: hypothetical protein F6K14_08515 [Symploca sp. SIO2C1]|nr:hypothetical protein [Symploca sp. SIO2C1]
MFAITILLAPDFAFLKALHIHITSRTLILLNMSQHNLKEKINTLCNEIQSTLVPIELLTVEESKGIIKRFVAATEGNFQCWLATALIASRSSDVRSTVEKNLQVEIQENHSSMLRKFAVNAHAEPDAVDFRVVSQAVEQVRWLVAECSGLKCIALIAMLESVSFIYPYLSSLARKAGSDDLTYTNIHEIEDPDHAEQFSKALSDEMTFGYNNPEQDIDEVISVLSDLYRSIFRCH